MINTGLVNYCVMSLCNELIVFDSDAIGDGNKEMTHKPEYKKHNVYYTYI